MTESAKRLRWLPRFGLRALFVIPLVVGLYLALGEPTRTIGIRDVRKQLSVGALEYRARLLLESSFVIAEARPGKMQIVTKSSYYFWLFGIVSQLPFSCERRSEFATVTGGTAAPAANGNVIAKAPRLP